MTQNRLPLDYALPLAEETPSHDREVTDEERVETLYRGLRAASMLGEMVDHPVLRDPLEDALSLYRIMAALGPEELDFACALLLALPDLSSQRVDMVRAGQRLAHEHPEFLEDAWFWVKAGANWDLCEALCYYRPDETS
ncbi:MAG: hypothetical protein JKY65_26030 [Planctomycetes bacterium]|nr:hypothetical protein [Planctomycetota bacterium]